MFHLIINTINFRYQCLEPANAGIVLAVEEVGLICRVDPNQARYLLKPLEAEDQGVDGITEEERDPLEAEMYIYSRGRRRNRGP
jgi:hypothetical protein